MGLILNLFKTKSNPKEGLELENTGAVDKLAFIRLNGRSPGLSLKCVVFNSLLAFIAKSIVVLS